MIRITRLSANLQGRDFVMGDLHGQLHWLRPQLASLAFDPARDRLFSVGDLIDRGEHSAAALALLQEPWFHAVLGNHEAMLIDSVLHGSGTEQWMRNGGEWSRDVETDELRRMAHQLKQLPHLIMVGTGTQRCHIVHAGLVDAQGAPLCDEQLDDLAFAETIEVTPLLRSRSLAREYKAALLTGIPATPLWHQGLSLTFCGHTPVPRPGLYQSHYFCDGGAGSEIYLQADETPRLHLIHVADVLPWRWHD